MRGMRVTHGAFFLVRPFEAIHRHDRQHVTGTTKEQRTWQTGGLLAKWIARTELDWIIRANDGSPQTEMPFVGGITRYQWGDVTVEGLVELTVEVTPLRDFSSSLP